MEETVSFPSEDVSWSSCRGAAEMNPTRNHEVASSIPGLAQWVKGSGVAVSCGVGCRCSLDLVLGCCRLATAALI